MFFSPTVMSCEAGRSMRPALTPLGADSPSPGTDPGTVSRAASAAMNISYASTPTACDRFRLVGPVPPVYLRLRLHSVPCPAVGMATHACACASSSLVRPVRSLPKSTATLPRLASRASISAATLAVTSGTFPRGLAVVAMTNVQSAMASSAVSHRLDSARSQSAAHAKRYASSQSGSGDVGSTTGFPSTASSGRVGRSAGGSSEPSPSGPSVAPLLTPPELLAPSAGVTSSRVPPARTNGPGSVMRRS